MAKTPTEKVSFVTNVEPKPPIETLVLVLASLTVIGGAIYYFSRP